jgi:hypothetical protein
LLSNIFVSQIFYLSLFTVTLYNWVSLLNIKNVITPLFKIYCAFMLYYTYVCFQFTDIIICAGTAVVMPSLICVHAHAVPASATTWLTRPPVCIVQGCPIAPLPGSLHTHTSGHKSYTPQHRGKNMEINLGARSKKTQYGGGGGYDGVKLREKSA